MNVIKEWRRNWILGVAHEVCFKLWSVVAVGLAFLPASLRAEFVYVANAGSNNTRENCDVTRWDRFADIKDIKKEMLERLETHFEKWLNP
jgi:hypothetical protein